MNILLNLYNFHEDWAREVLEDVFSPEMKVCLLPLSFHEDWIRNRKEWKIEYGPKGKCYLELVEPFEAYGILRKNISIVNYFTDTAQSAREKVEQADVLFFTGGFPDKMMARLYDLELVETIQHFQGIVMGSSAGAMIQFDTYHITPDRDYDQFQYHQGLGFLYDFEIEVHYEGSDVQNEAIERVMEERNLPVIAIGNEGGVLIDGDDCVPMGDVSFYGFDDPEEAGMEEGSDGWEQENWEQENLEQECCEDNWNEENEHWDENQE